MGCILISDVFKIKLGAANIKKYCSKCFRNLGNPHGFWVTHSSVGTDGSLKQVESGSVSDWVSHTFSE